MWFMYNNLAFKKHGRLAQLVEHLLDVQRVSGSSPLSSTNSIAKAMEFFFFEK